MEATEKRILGKVGGASTMVDCGGVRSELVLVGRCWSSPLLVEWSRLLRPLGARPSVLMERLLLFYRYMLPSFTSEAYSWADPVERVFGFKTGVENGLSS